jgi:predicted permease
MIRDLVQDLRYGLRNLRCSPGFTATVVLTLALGIGANAAIFSLINFVFLRPLPVRDAGGLVLFSDQFSAGTSSGTLEGGPLGLYAYPLYQRLRDGARSFDAMAAQQSGHTMAVVRGKSPAVDAFAEVATGRAVSAGYFDVVGVSAHRGRTFLPEDETAPGANPVTVLSHEYWQRRFVGDPAVVGSRLLVGGSTYTVIGVAAPDFNGTRVGVEVTDFWVPMTMQGDLMRDGPLLASNQRRWLVIAGRLKPGVSMTAAEAEANVILQQFLAERPALAIDDNARRAVRVDLVPGGRGISPLRHARFRTPLLVAMAGVGLLLLIVCLNVSHLMIARAVKRQPEMSIRIALGASRGRLARQLLAEGLLLSVAGAAAAVMLTIWMTDGLLALIPAGLSLTLDVRIDGRVLAFSALLAVATTGLLGLVPAWYVARPGLSQALQGPSRAIAGGGSQRRVGRFLLSSQVALSLVLLVTAGLMVQTLERLRTVSKGFDEHQVLMVELQAGLLDLTTEAMLRLQDDLLRRVNALPGVRSASLSRFSLLGGGHARERVWIAGGQDSVHVEKATVTPAHFQTLGIGLVQGRRLTTDDRPGAPAVVVINETMAHRLGGQPLGTRLQFREKSPDAPALQVVGIVRDVKNDGLRDKPLPTVYQPVAQAPSPLGSLEVRTVGDPALFVPQVRRAVREAHPGLPVGGVRTMRSQVERALTGERALAALSTAFGLAALLLVCVGLHGVISQWANLRTREIGVRMSLGATAGGVRWLVMRQAFTFVVAGAVVGLPAAIGVARLLRGFLFGLSPMDPATLAAATSLMFAVAALAAYLPARRAARLEPMAALRQE